MKYRLFVVFAFCDKTTMNLFKIKKDADLSIARALVRMREGDAYFDFDVSELFDEVYPFYLIYELMESVDEIKSNDKEDAS
jgi:hypothetical protein